MHLPIVADLQAKLCAHNSCMSHYLDVYRYCLRPVEHVTIESRAYAAITAAVRERIWYAVGQPIVQVLRAGGPWI